MTLTSTSRFSLASTHIIATATRHGIDTGALNAARAVIDRAIADGHGNDGLSYLTAATYQPEPHAHHGTTDTHDTAAGF